jgi:hypothetical protein
MYDGVTFSRFLRDKNQPLHFRIPYLDRFVTLIANQSHHGFIHTHRGDTFRLIQDLFHERKFLCDLQTLGNFGRFQFMSLFLDTWIH